MIKGPSKGFAYIMATLSDLLYRYGVIVGLLIWHNYGVNDQSFSRGWEGILFISYTRVQVGILTWRS